MILLKKMRDESFIEIEVDEHQAAFLLKHDPERYKFDTKKNPKSFKKEPEIKEPEYIPDLIDEES